MKGHVLRRLKPFARTIVTLYEEGCSLDDLAVRFSCASSTIRRFLIDQNIALRPPAKKYKLDNAEAEVMRAVENGDDLEAIARRFQVQKETVARYLVVKAKAIQPQRSRPKT